MAIKVGEKSLASQLVIGELTPAKVEAEVVQTIKADTPTTIEFKVFDANGVEITSSLGSEYDIAYTSPAVENDKVELPAGTQTTTKVQIKKGDAVVAESAEITIKAEQVNLTQISNWTVGAADFTDKEYKQVTSLAEGASKVITVQVKDQFGEISTPDSYTVEFASLDTTVGIVDKSTGEITTLAEGELPVEIKIVQNGKAVLTQTVIVNIIAQAKFDTLSLSESTVKMSALDTSGKTIKASLKDQFGNAWGNQSTVITATGDASNVEVTIGSLDAKTGELEISVKALKNAKAGSYTYDITVDNEKVAAFTVVLEEAGVFASYEVRGLKAEIDQYVTTSNDTMTITAVPVDKDNKAVGNAVASTLKVYDTEDATKAAITAAVNTNTINAAELEAGKEYVVEVTANENIISIHTFKVTNSTPAIQIDFTSTVLADVVTSDTALIAAINNVLIVDGKTVAEGAAGATKVTFITGDSKVIAEDGTVKTGSEATTIYVTSVTINGKVIELSNVPFTIETEKAAN